MPYTPQTPGTDTNPSGRIQYYGYMDGEDYLRAKSFPDQSRWSDLTINGKPIPDALHGWIWYHHTDQGQGQTR